MGYQNAFIVAAFAAFGYTLTVFPMIRWGRVLRRKSRERYLYHVNEAEGKGLAH